MRRSVTLRRLLFLASTFGCLAPTPVVLAGELVVPHAFVAGEPAVAGDVNENFAAVRDEVNDNHARLAVLENVIAGLSQRLAALEGQAPGVASFETHFGTDLVFVGSAGRFIIPYTGEPGQQSVPTPGDAVFRDTAFEFNALPGLQDVAFSVARDATLVILQTTGRAYNNAFQAASYLEVGISVDGQPPAMAATERIHILATHANRSGASMNWYVNYPVLLDAGEHTFSVMVKGFANSQDNITIDGRSTFGHPGRVRATVLQIKMPN